MKLPLLPADKGTHLAYGLGLFIALAFARSPEFAVVMVAVVGIVKEIYDKVSGTGTPEVLDAVATACGGLAGFVCTKV